MSYWHKKNVLLTQAHNSFLNTAGGFFLKIEKKRSWEILGDDDSTRVSALCHPYGVVQERIQRGVQGVRTTPLKKHKNIGFLNNTGPGPLNYQKIQNSMLGHHRLASETPSKWRFAVGPMLSRL